MTIYCIYHLSIYIYTYICILYILHHWSLEHCFGELCGAAGILEHLRFCRKLSRLQRVLTRTVIEFFLVVLGQALSPCNS